MELPEISFERIFHLIKKNFILILAISLSGFIAALLISTVVLPPVYVSTLKLYVSPPNNTEDLTSLTYARGVANTYIQLLQTNKFSSQVQEDTGLPYTNTQIRNMITYTLINNTEILKIDISASKPEEAVKLAQSITRLAPETIGQFKPGASLKIADDPTIPSSPSSPNVLLNCLIGLAAGAIVPAMFIFLRDRYDVYIKSEEDLQAASDLPLLAAIPSFDQNTRKKSFFKRSFGHAKKTSSASGEKA